MVNLNSIDDFEGVGTAMLAIDSTALYNLSQFLIDITWM